MITGVKDSEQVNGRKGGREGENGEIEEKEKLTGRKIKNIGKTRWKGRTDGREDL